MPLVMFCAQGRSTGKGARVKFSGNGNKDSSGNGESAGTKTPEPAPAPGAFAEARPWPECHRCADISQSMDCTPCRYLVQMHTDGATFDPTILFLATVASKTVCCSMHPSPSLLSWQ
mmetsp:Transcript_73031/g.138082  ORF Transcript_73031/g.138082 Transcript_73031/m.138082 type:complete len:117 (+) Transcript_73031:51-401(+)